MSTESGFRPTTYCTILDTNPESLTDEFGDPMDNETASATGVPIAIIIQASRQFLPSENRMTVVHTISARMRASVSVKETSRIKDERTGDIYMIEELVQPQSAFGSAAVRMTLKRVN